MKQLTHEEIVLRDQFAMVAMAHIINMTEERINYVYQTGCISKAAYIQADAMMAARKV